MTKFHLFSQDSAEYAFGILHWLETAPTGECVSPDEYDTNTYEPANFDADR